MPVLLTWSHEEHRDMLPSLLLLLALSVSAEMLGYSYELDSPHSGVKNRAGPGFLTRTFLLPLQRMVTNIQVCLHQQHFSYQIHHDLMTYRQAFNDMRINIMMRNLKATARQIESDRVLGSVTATSGLVTSEIVILSLWLVGRLAFCS